MLFTKLNEMTEPLETSRRRLAILDAKIEPLVQKEDPKEEYTCSLEYSDHITIHLTSLDLGIKKRRDARNEMIKHLQQSRKSSTTWDKQDLDRNAEGETTPCPLEMRAHPLQVSTLVMSKLKQEAIPSQHENESAEIVDPLHHHLKPNVWLPSEL